MSRRVKIREFGQVSQQIRQLLQSMTEFLERQAHARATTGLTDALDRWIPLLEKGSDMSIVDQWPIDIPLTELDQLQQPGSYVNIGDDLRTFVRRADEVLSLPTVNSDTSRGGGERLDALRRCYGLEGGTTVVDPSATTV
jgi:hypothetical protein